MDPRRGVPSVEVVASALSGLPRPMLVACAREAIDDARVRAARGESVDRDAVVAWAAELVDAHRLRALRPVLNATGVLLHTNLGRAPVDRDALAAAIDVAASYSNLEYDMVDGGRGSRHEHAGRLLARACGADAGIVVNNNAAAVLLCLAALARGREVIVSRGELVEIGGGFRVPEIMEESGCRLVEVGTTNRTRVADYERAVTPDTALTLKVHASNYRMTGFVESTGVGELARLAPPVMVDAGSGLLDATTPWLAERAPWLHDEPGVRQALDAGAAIVTFSGDKLLGGPQAGIVVGNAELVATVARHPLARAMRADKMTLAVLQDVAARYLSGDATAIPFWRAAMRTVDELRVRAGAIASMCARARVVDTDATAGGGSIPGHAIPSAGVEIDGDAPRVMEILRAHDVVARIVDGRVVCDLRGIEPDDDPRLAEALVAATT